MTLGALATRRSHGRHGGGYRVGMTGAIDPRNLLVSDAEREHVGQLLQRAVGQGRITIDEFDTRMAAAMAARTRGDLNAVVMDIAEAAPTAKGAGDTPAQRAAKNEVQLRGGMGDIKRRGYWVVPPTVKVTGGMGDTLLDFTEAELTSPVTTVEASLGMGDLTIVLPVGASVDLDDANCSIGSVNNRTARYRPEPGAPHFVVRATVRMGDVTVLYPRSWRFGPLTLHRPFRLTWGS